MRRTAGEARLAQHLLDCIRYGFAPTKVTWSASNNTNDISNFDPRRVFPDPRVQWGDWENMQYCVFTETLVAKKYSPVNRCRDAWCWHEDRINRQKLIELAEKKRGIHKKTKRNTDKFNTIYLLVKHYINSKLKNILFFLKKLKKVNFFIFDPDTH